MTAPKPENQKLTVPTDAELKNEHKYRQQWIVLRNVMTKNPAEKISRRKLLDEMSLAFANHYHLYDIQHINGATFELPLCLDEVFGNDADMRWLSDYLAHDNSGLSPRRMSKKIMRLRIIYLFLKIKFPRASRRL